MKIYINETACAIYKNPVASYVIYSAREESQRTARVRLVFDRLPEGRITVRPLSRGIETEICENEILFETVVPSKLSVEWEDKSQAPIFLFLYPPETEKPTGNGVRYLEKGEHILDTVKLESGETLYLEEGAVLHGHLSATNAENVTVCGRGIIDVEGEYTTQGRRVAHFYDCKRVTLRDVTFTGANGWCCMITGCEDVTVERINVMTWFTRGDGVDVVGSHSVTVADCFFRCADDCVAIKATDYRGAAGLRDVYDVSVSGCVMWNAQPGNGIEIGFETRCDEIYNVTFSDIDIIHCEHEGWQSGGAITIHNGDRAKIHHIVYRDIRIEDVCDKLFDFKVLQSNYSKDETRGSVEHILVENVRIVDGAFPPSILSGFAPNDFLVRHVRFCNVSVLGTPIRSIQDCRMIAERTTDIIFEVDE